MAEQEPLKILLHKSSENTGKNRINSFRTLEINYRLAAIWTFIQEKWLNLSKNSELCIAFYLALFPFFSLQLHSSLGHQQPPVMVKTSNLEATGRGRTRLELLHSPVPRKLSLFDLSGGSLKDLILKTIFDLTGAHPVQIAFPLLGCSFKTIRGSYWTS